MPIKKPLSLASKSTASPKTRSSASTSSRPLKSSSLLPLSKPAKEQVRKKRTHKAKDVDLRDQLNGQDDILRRALERNQPAEPIVKKKEPAPKELGPAGSDLAKAMDELEMAFAA
ncbi:hypothetical protein JCM10212_001015 [Sporobolomyces blumeae]